MWSENATGKAAFVPPVLESTSSGRSEGSSAETDWTQIRTDSGESQTVYNVRARSGSMTTNFSAASQNADGSPSSSGATYDPLRGVAQTSPNSPVAVTNGMSRDNRSAQPRGYELCVGCIEIYGINHSKAAAKEARLSAQDLDGRSRRKRKELRHMFREKIWGTEGWTDVGE